ncbi:hypothetical protein J421_5984 (plasmid) [Gemmatirosa kalamazoonensis]|uniref:Cytochrome c domain-containing protein n=1 Tax=Gemmatirosa kalamazoonensis TaxID=861299 RepID=W0RRA1_9BACT|nr:hypothetical protein [Gemmatirosa kalamazoonensis]AHG93519.1 hypothetical protein J421_5984 [Gemmatirosa kalamazoonensis]
MCRIRLVLAAGGIVLAACGGASAGDGPAAPRSAADIVALGHSAFVTSCAGCHASRDAFDVARFGFDDATIVRRAVKHVDSATARQIVAYVRWLQVPPIRRDTSLFQPGTTVLDDDRTFWRALTGTDGWPADLTPDKLRAIDPRTLSVPLRLPVWSSEADETDWMPERPLPAEILAGGVQQALDAYYAAPSDETMLRAVTTFQDAMRTRTDMCTGEIAFKKRPDDCFEAMRWMSAFTAVHLLRSGRPPASPPPALLDLWWDTGEAGVSRYFAHFPAEPTNVASAWMYLAYSFAPSRFDEPGGYLGQFLQSPQRNGSPVSYPRLATFTALRRMVDPGVPRDTGTAHTTHVFYDALLAMVRAPDAMKPDVARFTHDFLVRWLDTAGPLDDATRRAAADMVTRSYRDMPAALRDDLAARVAAAR